MFTGRLLFGWYQRVLQSHARNLVGLALEAYVLAGTRSLEPKGETVDAKHGVMAGGVPSSRDIEFAASLKYDLGVGRNGSDIVVVANDIY